MRVTFISRDTYLNAYVIFNFQKSTLAVLIVDLNIVFWFFIEIFFMLFIKILFIPFYIDWHAFSDKFSETFQASLCAL